MTKHPHSPGFPPPEPESLAQLRGDCARMAPQWRTGAGARAGTGTATGTGGQVPAAGDASASASHGVWVPSRSARLLDGMSEYGD